MFPYPTQFVGILNRLNENPIVNSGSLTLLISFVLSLFLQRKINLKPDFSFSPFHERKIVCKRQGRATDKEFKNDEYNNDAQFHAEVGTQRWPANLATDSTRRGWTKTLPRLIACQSEGEANNMDH